MVTIEHWPARGGRTDRVGVVAPAEQSIAGRFSQISLWVVVWEAQKDLMLTQVRSEIR